MTCTTGGQRCDLRVVAPFEPVRNGYWPRSYGPIAIKHSEDQGFDLCAAPGEALDLRLASTDERCAQRVRYGHRIGIIGVLAAHLWAAVKAQAEYTSSRFADKLGLSGIGMFHHKISLEHCTSGSLSARFGLISTGHAC